VIKPFRLIAGPLLALGAAGCLASKGDIRLLQEDLRASRAATARSDSALMRKSDSLAMVLSSLSGTTAQGDQLLQQAQLQFETRIGESLKAIDARMAGADLTTRERFKALEDDITQLQELVRQTARGSAAARAAVEQATVKPPPVAATTDSTAKPVTQVVQGPATLLVNGRSLIIQGSCGTARRSFQEVITKYPDSIEAPEAQYLIAESYVACDGGNPGKADSVYTIVTEKYPKTDFAATALYKRAEMQRTGGKPEVARPLYLRIICEYPKSTVYPQALDRVGGNKPVCRG
jgi:TolA-binding protein